MAVYQESGSGTERVLSGPETSWRTHIRLALLTNMVPPYHKPLFKLLSERYGGFRIFISTPREENRPWKASWQGLDVVVQKGLNIRRKWLHPGFGEAVTIHFPLDTISQLARYKPDVVLSGEMGARTLLALLYTKVLGHCKLLIWSEVTNLTEQGRGRMRHVVRRLLVKHVDGFLALGSGGVEYIKSLGVPERKIYRIAYTTEMNEFAQLDTGRSAQAARRMLYVGQLVERKGLMPFLGVMSKWAESHPGSSIEFLIAGHGPLESDLKAKQMPANVKLIFLGPLQYEDLPDVYKEAGIFVLPTLADTWGVVVNEAMASAIPVLGSRCSQAVEEMVEDGKTGWTFWPQMEDEVYNAIDQAMSCSDLELQTMRRQARLRALEVTPEYVADLVDVGVAACAKEFVA